MICHGCNNDALMLYATGAGHRCADCRDGLPPAGARKRPGASANGSQSSIEQPHLLVALGRSKRRRRIGRIAILRRIEANLQAEIDVILRRDPELRALKYEATVAAYRKAIRIVRGHHVISRTASVP